MARHLDTTATPDRTPNAACTEAMPWPDGVCRDMLCARHEPSTYADSMARHAAAYNGERFGLGSSI